MAELDLQACRKRFDEVCEREFGQKYNLRKLEKDFSYLRSSKQWLSARHVASLFDPSRTPFAKYWQKPNDAELNAALQKARVCLAFDGANGQERDVVQRLLGALHNLGIVSLVLRFVHPERFGTFSTPVVYLLQVHRESAVELYLAYCAELMEWQKHFHLASVADTETALWTFHKLATGSTKISPNNDLRAQFDGDKWIQRRRASQAIKPLVESKDPLALAWILAELSPKLAGKIAGEEYERLLRCAARRFYPARRWNFDKERWAGGLLSEMKQHGHISAEDLVLLNKRVWPARNSAVHPSGKLNDIDVELMIETIERICRPWDQEGKKAPAK